MTGLERIALEVIAGLFLVWGTVMYLEHRGAAQCRAADAIAVAKQEGHNEAQGQQDAKTLTNEAKAHADALSADPMPTPSVICVRIDAGSSPLLPATAPKPNGHGQAQLSTPDYRPVRVFTGGIDIAKPAAKIGQTCDAQVIEAQAYITDICRPKQ